MPQLKIHKSVREDLQRMLTQPDGNLARDRMLNELQTLRTSKTLQRILLERSVTEFDGKLLDVSQWQSQQNEGNDLWRLKQIQHYDSDIFPLLGSYRIIYKICEIAGTRDKRITILAVVHRKEFDYENGTTDISRRILRDYDS